MQPDELQLCSCLEGNHGWSALHHAAAAGQTEIVKVLGAAGEGVMVDARTWEGETPLLLACKRLPAAKAAELKLKANPNLATNKTCSALQWACMRGEVEVEVEELWHRCGPALSPPPPPTGSPCSSWTGRRRSSSGWTFQIPTRWPATTFF